MAKDQENLSDEMPLELSPDLDPDMLQEFINDAREHLDHIEEGILILESNAHDLVVINTIFRAFHTFKGNAGFLELVPISKLAHILESLLDRARDNNLEINRTIIDIILRGRDTLKLFVDEIEAQITGKKPRQTVIIPTSAQKTTIQRILDGGTANIESSPIASPIIEDIPPIIPHEIPPPTIEPLWLEEKEPAPTPEKQKIIPIEKEISHSPRAPTPTTPAAAHATANTSVAENSGNAVKVSTNKLDSLVDLAGELVIAKSLIVENVSSGSLNRHALIRNLAHLNRISKELQRTAMSMRMVPIRSTFQKMHRLIRDIATRQKKDVQLILEGENTEIDRTIIEKISDPLMHMIRNAVDHAIELPHERSLAHKCPTGSIYLRAYHKSGNVVIEVQDDGKGLNKERIFSKAVSNGLISADTKLEDNELFNLIFTPGFSTAEVVTDVSGRGVGMDVVHKNIHKLRGKIDIVSVVGHGTKFTIHLPLTLAIIDGLIIRVSGQRYILSAISVRESFHPKSCRIVNIPGRGEVIYMRNEIIPLLRLREHFGCNNSSVSAPEGIMIVIESDNQKRCLLADELVGKQEVVIKNLGEVFKTDPMVSGGAILGDGCVGLILDPAALVKLEPPGKEPFTLAA